MYVKQIILSAWASAKPDPSSPSIDPWLPIKRTAKNDQTGWMLRLILFLSGRTDHLVDLCHAPAYFRLPLWPKVFCICDSVFFHICDIFLTYDASVFAFSVFVFHIIMWQLLHLWPFSHLMFLQPSSTLFHSIEKPQITLYKWICKVRTWYHSSEFYR